MNHDSTSTPFYIWIGGNASKLGRFVTNTFPQGNARSVLALPPNNSETSLTTFQLRPEVQNMGTIVFIIATKGLPKLHSTPLTSVYCSDTKVVVEADDENESRLKIVFEPYQVIRMITVDCFDIPDGMTDYSSDCYGDRKLKLG